MSKKNHLLVLEKYKMLSKLLLFALSLTLVVVYQNCSGGFVTLSGVEADQTALVNLTPTEIQVFG